MSARGTIERELFEICGAPEYGVDTETTADRILTALSASGYVIVPREPTGEMIQAAILTHVSENKGIEHAPYLSWKAMIAALHPAKDETK